MVLRTYANFLMHGGRKQDWLDLTDDDIWLMTMTYRLDRREMLESFFGMLAEAFNGEKQ